MLPATDRGELQHLRRDMEARNRFRGVMEQLLNAEDEYELPGIVSSHVHVLLDTNCSALLAEMQAEAPNQVALDTLNNAYEFLLAFMELFVEQTIAIQHRNQQLLSEMLTAARAGITHFETKMTEVRDRLDVTLLTYLDGEAERMKAAGGAESLQAVSVIRARVAAEIDKLMGEEVSILNRLLGFEDRLVTRKALDAAMFQRSAQSGQRFVDLVRGTLQEVQKRSQKDFSLEIKLQGILEDTLVISRDWVADAELQQQTDDSSDNAMEQST